MTTGLASLAAAGKDRKTCHDAKGEEKGLNCTNWSYTTAYLLTGTQCWSRGVESLVIIQGGYFGWDDMQYQQCWPGVGGVKSRGKSRVRTA